MIKPINPKFNKSNHKLARLCRSALVLSLILSLSIPSYAAVSVSDGSAFVSKAEFSADINNLSQRMSQLENSLDAKIDSLVSSYLSRNGIWNGVAQMIVKPGGYGYNFRQTNEVSKIWYKKNGNVTSTYRVFDTTKKESSTIIDECNKSGMICLNFEFRNDISQSSYGKEPPDDTALTNGVENATSDDDGLYPSLKSYNVSNGSPYLYIPGFDADGDSMTLIILWNVRRAVADDNHIVYVHKVLDYFINNQLVAIGDNGERAWDIMDTGNYSKYGVNSDFTEIGSVYFFVNKGDKLYCDAQMDTLSTGGAVPFASKNGYRATIGTVFHIVSASIY